MKTIKLSDAQITNANIFLERVELRGLKEAVALIELSQSINSTNGDSEEEVTPEKG